MQRLGDGGRTRSRYKVRMVLKPNFPPRKDIEAAMQRCLDRDEIVFIDFFEDGGAVSRLGRLEQKVL